jgi:hypothetical protein
MYSKRIHDLNIASYSIYQVLLKNYYERTKILFEVVLGNDLLEFKIDIKLYNFALLYCILRLKFQIDYIKTNSLCTKLR